MEHEALVVTDGAGQRTLQLRDLAAEGGLGQLGQLSRVGLSCGQALEHRTSGNAHNIASDIAELDVGALQQLLDPLHHRRPLLDKAASVADQLTQLPMASLGNEAGLEQTVLKQLGQPLGVFDVGLTPGHRLDVTSVDDQEFDALALEQVVDRLPVHASGLHCCMRHALLLQPGQQLQQLRSHGPERSCPPTFRRQHARHHSFLVDVEAAAPLVNRSHPATSNRCYRPDERPAPVERFPCVLPLGGATFVGALRSPAHVNYRAPCTKETRAFRPAGAFQFSSSVASQRDMCR